MKLLTTNLLEKERERLLRRRDVLNRVKKGASVLIVIWAVAYLVFSFCFIPLRIYGNSMSPTLFDGELVVADQNAEFISGELVAFSYNNQTLIKRLIAGPGDWVDIDEDGTVYVNGKELIEPYVMEKALGDSNLEYPYQVPENRWFVMGDHRAASHDSRNMSMGCIETDQIFGSVIWRVWPLERTGNIRNQ